MASPHETLAASLIIAGGVQAPVTAAEFSLEFEQMLRRCARKHLTAPAGRQKGRQGRQDPDEEETENQEALAPLLKLLVDPVDQRRRAALGIFQYVLLPGVFARLVTNLVGLLTAREPVRTGARASLVELGPSALHALISALRCGTDPIEQLAVCEVIAVIARRQDEGGKLSLLCELRGCGFRVTNDAVRAAIAEIIEELIGGLEMSPTLSSHDRDVVFRNLKLILPGWRAHGVGHQRLLQS